MYNSGPKVYRTQLFNFNRMWEYNMKNTIRETGVYHGVGGGYGEHDHGDDRFLNNGFTGC